MGGSSADDGWLRPGLSWPIVLLASFGIVSIGVLVAFFRWSAWWPHADMRQTGVTLLGVILGITGGGAFTLAVVALPTRFRLIALAAAIASGLLGSSIGFQLLRDATAVAR